MAKFYYAEMEFAFSDKDSKFMFVSHHGFDGPRNPDVEIPNQPMRPITDYLNAVGSVGWRLIEVVTTRSHGDGDHFKFLFARS